MCSWLRGSWMVLCVHGVRIAPAAHPRGAKRRPGGWSGGRARLGCAGGHVSVDRGRSGSILYWSTAAREVCASAVLESKRTIDRGGLGRIGCARRWAGWCGAGLRGLARCGPVHLPVWGRVAGVVVGWMGSRLVVRGTGLVTSGGDSIGSPQPYSACQSATAPTVSSTHGINRVRRRGRCETDGRWTRAEWKKGAGWRSSMPQQKPAR